MDEPPVYDKPLHIERPYGTHRFDVYSAKLGRRLTLFGWRPFKAWLVLERDPAVRSFCEYPLSISDVRPDRVIDFWIQWDTGPVFWFLLRDAEQKKLAQGTRLYPAFEQWAFDRGASIRLVDPAELEVPQPLLANYELALHYIVPNLQLVADSLREAVWSTCALPHSLCAIERKLSSTDPILVRTAVFAGMLDGTLLCEMLHERVLGPHSVFRSMA